MPGHHFLSYSRTEGEAHASRLREALRAATPSFTVWMDCHDARPGQAWDVEIDDAIRTCTSLLFIMTADSVDSRSVCKKEWSRALSFKKPIIPLLFERRLEVPFLLQDRQYIDCTGSFEEAVARLCQHLAWLTSPAGVLHTLKDRLADARRDLRRAADPAERQRAEEDVAALEEQVGEQQRLVDDPKAAARTAQEAIARGMEHDRQARPTVAPATRLRFVNPPPTVAPAYFQGRQTEMGLLAGFLADDAVRLVWVVGRGGVGKTTLVCRTLATPPAGTELLDRARMLEDCGGDGELLRELCQVFQAEVPRCLAEVQGSYRNQDARHLATAAHRLCGMLRPVSPVASELAAELERCAIREQPPWWSTAARPLVEQLETTVGEVLRQVREFLSAGLSILGGVVCLGGNSAHRVSLANFLADLGQLLPAEKVAELGALFKNPQANLETRMRSLLAAPFAGRVALLLDSFEDLIDLETQQISDAEVAGALRAILTLPPHPVKVIVTTRLVARDLALVQPARQARLDLDEGLPSPHAENVLRAMDVDGKLGLKAAPAELLAEARRRTGGYPRALEALFAILSADRGTSLRELLAGDSPLPENVVEALVGEAFDRLDGRSQQVMQALGVYARPVTAAAVDYLLQPYLPGLSSRAVLGRLVNLRLAHKEEDRYGLHPADRAYALGRVPWGQRQDRAAGESPPFTQLALLRRAADYFREVRQPHAAWQGPPELNPYLAELDLRQAAQDHEAVAALLQETTQAAPAPQRPAEATVLVVDDSPMDRLLVGGLLERELAARVVYAGNGVEALAELERGSMDLVVTDLQMPEMDGLELVAEVRRKYPLVPVVLMTGVGTEELALLALQRGAASYVPKRSLTRDLEETVRSALAVAQAARGQQRLLECRTRAEEHFTLDNDPSLIEPLVSHLQNAFTSPQRQDDTAILVGVALHEALFMAMSEGNLELSADLRAQDQSAYDGLVKERRVQPPYRDRKVHVSARQSPDEAVYTIRNEGPGFDPSLLPDPTDPANLAQVSGRGLLLIQTFMDQVTFNASGTEMTLVKRRPREGGV